MIERLTLASLSPQDAEDIRNLYRELNPNKAQRPPHQVLRPDNPAMMVVYRQKGRVVGMATMAWYEVTSNYKGWIEDVVVAREHRGQGTGRKLVEALLEEARRLCLSEVFLYTEEEKQAAMHLYQSLGFAAKGSRLYHLKWLD
jgi:ribosomal protein S18 acetylase RimI-like enzyme